jgi:hypothetical protein
MSAPLDKESDEYKAFCKQSSDRAKKRWEDPEERRKQSESASKSWENEDIRKARSVGITQAWENDPVLRENQIKLLNKMWEDLLEREKQSAIAAKRWGDPKEIEKQSLKAIKRWENPLNRELQAIMILERRYGGIWYGNITYYDGPQYCEKFNGEFKERVRAFRGYICFECGEIQNNKKLSIHHVHYDKKMCCNGSPQDVVPLCTSCHTKTNHNREYWEDHFTEMIYENDPTGKCFFTKEEMKEYRKSL